MGSPEEAPVEGEGRPAKPQLQGGVSPPASEAKGQEPLLRTTCKGPVKCSAVAPVPTRGRGALLATSRVWGHGDEGVRSERERAGVGRAQAGQQGRAAPSFLPGRLLIAAQQLHAQGNAVVPGHGQDADEAGVEGHVEHILLVRVVVTVTMEDLGRARWVSAPQGPPCHHPIPTAAFLSPGRSLLTLSCPTHLGAVCLAIPVEGPGCAVVTVGHLVGCHVLDVPKVTGSLCDDASHLLLVPEVNLAQRQGLSWLPAAALLPAQSIPYVPELLTRSQEWGKLCSTPITMTQLLIKHSCKVSDP